MVVELPTAFIYFGAISAILAARLAAPAEISLLITYNAVFAAPLIACLALRRLAGSHGDDWIASAEATVRRVGRFAVVGVAAAAGGVLLAIGAGGLLGA
jgi:hypothetical protein